MIKVIYVGKVKDKHLQALIQEYQAKLQHYHKFQFIEVKDESIGKFGVEKIKEIEAERIVRHIQADDYLIVLDLQGKQVSSEEFSQQIDGLVNQSKTICFVIGGSLGIAQELVKQASYNLQLSKMTFIHNMALLILLEQLYRGFKILKNETYHK